MENMVFGLAYRAPLDSPCVDCPEDGEFVAQQHYKEQADVNRIVERFLKTGEVPQVTTPPVYGDFTANDFLVHSVKVAEVREAFNSLPGEDRLKFDNDPVNWLAHLEEEAKKAASAAPAPVPDAPAPAAPDAPAPVALGASA